MTRITATTVALWALLSGCGLAVAATHTGWIEFRRFHYEGRSNAETRVKDPRRQYANPILAGFYPDPSIVRRGDDYYLVNSSFSWFPGVPIFRSRDLVSWTQLGHVLDRPSQLPLDGAGVSGGIFAPSIRFHDGLFYMITTNITGIGNFYVTAKDPAGPWSEPVALPEIQGIDPSFFFDEDGRAYIVHNGAPPGKPAYEGHRAIWLFPFDVKAGRVSGPGSILVNGGTDLAKHPIWIEGPHLFQHQGYYYLIAAEGGTAEQHSEVVFRSRKVEGPYVGYAANPILTQRSMPEGRPAPVTSTGHADFVETRNGKWWAVFLGCEPYQEGAYNTGRETFLLPVSWKDGWPVVLPPGRGVPRVVDRPRLPVSQAPAIPTTGTFSWTDDFRGPQLSSVYNLLRTPAEKWWSVGDPPGMLRLEARSEDLDSRHNPSLVAHRQQHADFAASVDVVFHPEDAPSDAGLVAFQNETHSYFLGVAYRGRERTLFLEKRNGEVSRVAEVPLPASAHGVTLKVQASGAAYQFLYREDGSTWKPIGPAQDGTILSTRSAGGFVGTYLGMFARRRE